MPSSWRECAGVGQRPEELLGHGVRHDEDLPGGDAAGHDLLPHGLAEGHDEVGGQHAPGLEVAVAAVQLAAGQVRAVRVPGQPGVLPEPADLIHHGQPVPLPQGQRDQGVGVVARGVQHARPYLLGEPCGEFQPQGGRFVGAARHAPRQQPVVRDAVQRDQAPAVQPALGHREPAPGHHVRIQPGGLLGEHDLVGPDRVPRARGGQRVVHQVQDAAGRSGCFMIVGQKVVAIWPELAHDHGIARLGGARTARSAARRVRRRRARRPGAWPRVSSGVGEAAFAPGQAGGQHGAGAIVAGQPGHGGGRGRRLIHGQAERGQAPGRGVERGQGRGPVPRAPQRRRPSVGPGEPEASAQPVWQYSLG